VHVLCSNIHIRLLIVDGNSHAAIVSHLMRSIDLLIHIGRVIVDISMQNISFCAIGGIMESDGAWLRVDGGYQFDDCE